MWSGLYPFAARQPTVQHMQSAPPEPFMRGPAVQWLHGLALARPYPSTMAGECTASLTSVLYWGD